MIVIAASFGSYGAGEAQSAMTAAHKMDASYRMFEIITADKKIAIIKWLTT